MEGNQHFDTGNELFFGFDLEFDLCTLLNHQFRLVRSFHSESDK
jgi:hypothetical protein